MRQALLHPKRRKHIAGREHPGHDEPDAGGLAVQLGQAPRLTGLVGRPG